MRRISCLATILLAVTITACSSGKTEEKRVADQRDGYGAPIVSPEAVKPSPVPEPILAMPAGTQLSIRMSSALSTHTNAAGSPFLAELQQPLMLDGRVIAEPGTLVSGLIADSNPGGRVKGVAHLGVRLTELRLPNGSVRISTDIVWFSAPRTRKRDALAIGAASGVGALIGGLVGGGKGAAIGAGVGGGAGTGGVLLTRGKPAVIPAGSVVNFRLKEPVQVS